MGGRVGSEPTCGLVELPLTSRPVPAPSLVPRHRDVNQSLEEVALLRRRGPPGLLERLVRGEVLAAVDEIDPALEIREQRVFSHPPWYAHPVVATILVAGVDVYFRGKLDALLGGRHKLVTTDSVDSPDLVIVDIARVDPEEVAEEYPDIPILGFTNHTDTAGLRAAHAAGFDRVVVRSALAERAPQLVDELVA